MAHRGQVVGGDVPRGDDRAGGVAAVVAGLLAAATVHLVVGSPGGRPTACAHPPGAARGSGVDVVDLAPASMHARASCQFSGTDAEGPLSVKVYGRDAWDGQLLANLWRLAWYRDTSARPA